MRLDTLSKIFYLVIFLGDFGFEKII